MKRQLLLLEDVDGLGRSGDIVSARPGYIRNFLVPKKKAVIADKSTLQMQAALKEEREKRAAKDRAEAEKLAARLVGFVLKREVKVDPEGNMYGSVSALEIARMMQEKGYEIDRGYLVLLHPIRTLGTHQIPLKLKEGISSSITLEVEPEGGFAPPTSEERKSKEAS